MTEWRHGSNPDGGAGRKEIKKKEIQYSQSGWNERKTKKVQNACNLSP